AIFNKAYGQTSSAPTAADVLRFALKLEYLESFFYDQGLGQAGQAATTLQTQLRGKISPTNLIALDKIRNDEANHVKLLAGALGANAGPIPSRTTTFDFTGGKGSMAGPFADVFTNPATFLAVAQSLEDTGVRAYKGGAPYLMSADKNPATSVLEIALNIHSVEARHASRLRTMRRAGASNDKASQAAIAGADEASRTASPKSWVSFKDNGGAAPMYTAAIYGAGVAPAYTPSGIDFPDEANVTQGGVNLQTALASLNFPASAFSEAFDEPLPVPTVLNIANTFVVTGNNFFM
ncbi:MAG TPA: ferritin-like domain-containing protein, partial [Hymenobacter sp.]